MHQDRPEPYFCILDWLRGQPDCQAELSNLPDDLKKPGLLRAAASHRLIEFGLPRPIDPIDGPIIYDRSWCDDLPKSLSLSQLLQDESNATDPRERPVVRLTGAGKDCAPGAWAAGRDANVTSKTEIIMGDKYENMQGSTVVSRSEVKGSFNRTRDDHSTKGATGGVWKWLTTGLWTSIKKCFGW